MIQPINRDQAILSTKSVDATPMDLQIVTDLLDTMKAHQEECVGMAANMIGQTKRIIVVQMGIMPVAMINPKITKKIGPSPKSEGCLSLDGQRTVTRYHSITVKYLDQQFKPHMQQFTDFIAQIIQHEVDHCDGVLI